MGERWFLAESDWDAPEGVTVLDVRPGPAAFNVYVRLKAEDWDWLQGDLQACEGPGG